MGIKIFGHSCDNSISVAASAIPDGNPNKFAFTVKRRMDFGKVTVVEINYPDCYNHNGNKILVYSDKSIFEQALKDKCLDPHFLEVGKSPVARFEPTKIGWIYATAFADMLTKGTSKNL